MIFRVSAVAALIALVAGAQSWEAVRALRPGDHVRVLETSGRESSGTVSSVSADAIVIEHRSVETAIDRGGVERVKVRSSSRRLRNLAIGAGIGLAAGLTTDQTLGVRMRNEGSDNWRALYYLAPIAIFGGIGAALAPYRTVYRSR